MMTPQSSTPSSPHLATAYPARPSGDRPLEGAPYPRLGWAVKGEPPHPGAVPGGHNVPAVASLLLGLLGVPVCLVIWSASSPASSGLESRITMGLFGIAPLIGVVGVLAVIFGGVGISRSKSRGGVGRGPAIAGIILGVATVLVGLGLAAFLLLMVQAFNNCAATNCFF